MGRADGRGVLMGCQEPLAGVLGSALDWRGLVWCEPGMPAGISRCFRLCYGGAGGLRSCRGVVTSGAKRGGTGGDALRRSMHGGGSRDVRGRVARAYGDWLSAAVVAIVALAVVGE
jgi:hypothetical protein